MLSVCWAFLRSNAPSQPTDASERVGWEAFILALLLSPDGLCSMVLVPTCPIYTTEKTVQEYGYCCTCQGFVDL
jgi:hypothetical protein